MFCRFVALCYFAFWARIFCGFAFSCLCFLVFLFLPVFGVFLIFSSSASNSGPHGLFFCAVVISGVISVSYLAILFCASILLRSLLMMFLFFIFYYGLLVSLLYLCYLSHYNSCSLLHLFHISVRYYFPILVCVCYGGGHVLVVFLRVCCFLLAFLSQPFFVVLVGLFRAIVSCCFSGGFHCTIISSFFVVFHTIFAVVGYTVVPLAVQVFYISCCVLVLVPIFS